MASTRPKAALSFNQNRRINPFPDLDRMRISCPSAYINNPDYEGADIPPPLYLNPGAQGISNNQSVPPPVPPRSDVSRSSRYSSNYNSYYSPSPSPYSRFSPNMYSSYGGYRTPYSRFGMPPGPDSYNSFIQLAEESTRPAFESIESVVDIVGSISMMLESTYHAVYSSYNAILGVVDQFSRLKDHLAEVLSFLALVRGLRFLCLKLLYLLRLRKDNPSVEAAWKTAKSVYSEHPDFSQFRNDKKSPWPIFMFIGLVVGAPWLMFKLLSRSVSKKPFDISSWQEKNNYLICIGNYDFNTSRRGEISFQAGEQLYVAPRNLQVNVPKGWMLACNKRKQVGLVPRNYLKTTAQLSTQKKARVVGEPSAKPMQVIPENTAFPKVDPVNPFASENEPSTSEIVSITPKDEENTENK